MSRTGRASIYIQSGMYILSRAVFHMSLKGVEGNEIAKAYLSARMIL